MTPEINAALARIDSDLAFVKAALGQSIKSAPANVLNGRYIVEKREFTQEEAEAEINAIRQAERDGFIDGDKRRGAIMRVTVQTVASARAPLAFVWRIATPPPRPPSPGRASTTHSASASSRPTSDVG